MIKIHGGPLNEREKRFSFPYVEKLGKNMSSVEDAQKSITMQMT